MSRRAPRWELSRAARWDLVRTDAGWHIRFVARNGRIIVASEVYTRRERAVKAARLVQFGRDYDDLRIVDERSDAH